MKITKMLTALLFIVAAGCNPKLEIEDDQDFDTTVTETDAQASDIHGGSLVPEDWDSCNAMPGNHPCNFSFEDQYVDTFELYDNYGKVIVLDFSTMWCSVCQNLAPDIQAYQDTYGPRGFLWVTVLVDNSSGEPPTADDIQDWSTMFGIETSPVLVGDRSIVDLTGTTGYPISSWPTMVVIDKEMVIYNGLHGWNETTILSWIEGLL